MKQAVRPRVAVGTALCAVVALAALLTTAAPARGASTSAWYWTPGLCKSKLQNYGVSIGDGRTFNVEKAFCVGEHNHCWLQGGRRRYKVFIAVMRSYDGVVRRMVLEVTGKTTWRGSGLRVLSSYMSLDQFDIDYGSAAWIVASGENQGGCYDVHP